MNFGRYFFQNEEKKHVFRGEFHVNFQKIYIFFSIKMSALRKKCFNNIENYFIGR